MLPVKQCPGRPHQTPEHGSPTFSENNVIYTNKTRSNYISNSTNDVNNLPILKNNTYDSIYYINDLENFKKKRKKRFWESLISNFNE